METFNVSTIKVDDVLFNTNLTGSFFLVDTDCTIGKAIKTFQYEEEELGKTKLLIDGKETPTFLSDFNHFGIMVNCAFKTEVSWKYLLLKKIPVCKVVDTPTLNNMIYEQTQYPGKSVLAANLLSPTADYISQLGDRYTNIIIAIPKFKTFTEAMLHIIREECGTEPYSYSSLPAFIKFLKTGKWVGNKNLENTTCSQEGGRIYTLFLKDFKKQMITPTDQLIYNTLLDFFKEPYKLAPIHYFLLQQFFDFKIIVKNK